MDLKNQMNQIYGNRPLDKIPWNIKEPPQQLVDLVESGTLSPGPAIDLGCGIGNYAIWLAKKGFQVTGIDLSQKAIEFASKNAQDQNVDCIFKVGDLTDDQFNSSSQFQFAYDWEVLHHIFPEQRLRYFANVAGLLKTDGLYFSACFSEEDPDFGGTGKFRKTPIDTTLYFSSEEEIKQNLEPFFEIKELHTSQIEGKYGPHKVIIFLAVKK